MSTLSAVTEDGPAVGDGLDNKERWHWRERDLRDFVTGWLEHAFVQHGEGLLFDDAAAGVRCRVTTIRGDFGDDGAALLHWRKGKCFATYGFSVRFEYLASHTVGERSLGQARGVVWLHDICSDVADPAAEDAARPLRVEGAWEKANPNQPPTADGGPPPQREPAPYEEHIKAAVQRAAPEPVSRRVQQLRRSLAALAADGGNDLPPGQDAAAAVLREDEAREVEVAAGASGGGVTPSASAAAAEYVEDLRRQHRSERHKAALVDSTMVQVNLAFCDLRGVDLAELVDAAFKPNTVATTLDLSNNPQLDDAALQPLLIALATGAMPALTTLRLRATGAATVTKTMVQGLKMMRKTLTVELDA